MTEATEAKRRTLFEITGDMLSLFDMIDDAETDQEANEILCSWFDEHQQALESKADGYAAVVREFEARATARMDEARRLSDSARTMGNRVQSMKERFMLAMQVMEMDRLETDLNKFTVCRNGGKLPLEIIDPQAVPSEYTYQVTEIDKDKLRDALSNGEPVAGARLVERGRHLRIR